MAEQAKREKKRRETVWEKYGLILMQSISNEYVRCVSMCM